MVYRRCLDGSVTRNDNDSDKERIREVVSRKIENILDANVPDITENEIKRTYAMVEVDMQMERWESPHQFKLACQQIIEKLLDLFR